MARSELALLCALCTGCSLSGLDDLARGAPDEGEAGVPGDASPDDGGAPARDTSLAEEDTDTGVPDIDASPDDDGGPDPVADAGPDGGVDAGAPDSGARFCQTQPAVGYCTTFESASLDDEFTWLELNGEPEGSVRFVNGGIAPGTYALETALTGTNEQGARGVLQFPTDSAVSGVELSFWVDLTELRVGPERRIAWASVQQTTTTNEHPAVSLERHDGHDALVVVNHDGTRYVDTELDMDRLLPDGWQRVSMFILYGEQGRVVIQFNGSTVLDRTLEVRSANVRDTYLQLGLYKIAGVPGGKARYDDVDITKP